MRIRDTETGADHSCRCAARWMPAIQEYIDRIVDVLVFEKMGSCVQPGRTPWSFHRPGTLRSSSLSQL